VKGTLKTNYKTIMKNKEMIALVNKDRRAHPHKQLKNAKLNKFKKMKLVQPT